MKPIAFVLSAALERTGVLDVVGAFIKRVARGSLLRAMLVMMVVLIVLIATAALVKASFQSSAAIAAIAAGGGGDADDDDFPGEFISRPLAARRWTRAR